MAHDFGAGEASVDGAVDGGHEVVAHAVLGLWAVVADYSAGTRRLVIRATVFAVAGLLLLGGLAVIIVGAPG